MVASIRVVPSTASTSPGEATEMEVKQVEPRVNRDVQKVKATERGVKRVER